MSENNKVHFDLTNVHVAPLTIEGGIATFGDPERIYGAVSLDLAPQGNIVKLRADGIDYYVNASNNGYDGNLNLAQVPDSFRIKYLGEQLTANDKVLLENSLTGKPKPFALLFEFLGDVKHRRHVLFNCVANRPGIKGENKENQKDPDTETLPVTAIPLPNGNVKASTTEDTPDAIYSAWNDAVWTGDSGAAAAQANAEGDDAANA